MKSYWAILSLLFAANWSFAYPFLPVPSRVKGFRLPIALMGSMAEKVLEKPKFPEEWPYSENDFARMDESSDAIFYDSPRLVTHIDDPAISALTKYYSEHLKDGDDVLDICSSWVSHYPNDWKGGKVVGLGMNEYELKNNPQLTEYVVKDLNEEAVLPFEDASFDKVTCVVSVDYLNKPLPIFKEIGRVLRPGGQCFISMSNRCFPTKAFQVSKN
jgi:SAM-dependent methyltransferase